MLVFPNVPVNPTIRSAPGRRSVEPRGQHARARAAPNRHERPAHPPADHAGRSATIAAAPRAIASRDVRVPILRAAGDRDEEHAGRDAAAVLGDAGDVGIAAPTEIQSFSQPG